MPRTSAYEAEVLSAFDKGSLKSVATKAELSKIKAAARATAIKSFGNSLGAAGARRLAHAAPRMR